MWEMAWERHFLLTYFFIFINSDNSKEANLIETNN